MQLFPASRSMGGGKPASELIFDRATNRVHVEKNLPLVGEVRGGKSEIEVFFGEPVKDIFAADDPVGSQCVLYAAADVKTVQPSVLGDSERGRGQAAGARDRLVCICECPAAGDIQQRIRLNRVAHATTKSAYARVSEFIGETERLSRDKAARVQIVVAIDEGAKFAFGAEHYGTELIIISNEATDIESAGRDTSAGKQRAAPVHRAEGTARVTADVKAGPGEGSDVRNWRRRLFAGGQVGSESCGRQRDADRSEQIGTEFHSTLQCNNSVGQQIHLPSELRVVPRSIGPSKHIGDRRISEDASYPMARERRRAGYRHTRTPPTKRHLGATTTARGATTTPPTGATPTGRRATQPARTTPAAQYTMALASFTEKTRSNAMMTYF